MRATLMLCAGVVVAGAGAGEPAATYLEPDPGQTALGPETALVLRQGTDPGAAPIPWPDAGVPWMFVRTDATQRNRHRVEAPDADLEGVRVRLGGAGVTMVGVELPTRTASLDETTLRRLLAEHATLEPGSPAIDVGARVRRVESAKALIRLPGHGNAPADVATSKSGQRAELRALVDPTATPMGSHVWVRAYVQGSALAGARIVATSLSDGRRREAIADTSGIASFALDAPGRWRVEFHHLSPLVPDPPAGPAPDADPTDEPAAWTLYSATLTFDAQEKGGRP